ncbi:unnamed protein product [Chrysodeixis includens]|uniref:FAD-binding PCMH-type domain-containing protein n=1 Tax=Chrysodeixis includens TaxID=689277 RepID=A0A9P0FZ50_CHRIL|nr:unnamed protein product [Chrysodeixis includens]
MCREAGCGACVLSVRRGDTPSYAVNSCMMPVTSCHGMEVTTIEELGNRHKGYHALQKTLAEDHGSQCGYCSPGWVMAMYSLIQSNPNITMLEIEKSLGSNFCRCTGYRPILDAFKKFAKDAPRQITLPDIEDLHICKMTGEECNKIKCEDNEYPRVLIDISGVQELKSYVLGTNLTVNAGTTLTEFLEILKTVSTKVNFGYLEKVYAHILDIAHIPVRNVASIAGNLMLKNQNNWFSSDIFLLLETVGAQVTVQMNSLKKETLTMQEFMKTNMIRRVILNIILPPLSKEHRLVTFKIMPRSQSAHAIINAGFLYKMKSVSSNVVKDARIVFGGLSSSFVRATATEKFLAGRSLFTNDTLTSALKKLKEELVVVEHPPEPSVEYRKKAALGLFYKGLLQLAPNDIVGARYRSGAINLHDSRPVSRAVQTFEINQEIWPVNQPIMQVDSLLKTSGEAFFVDDLPTYPNEVFCALALSTVAVGDIVSIDASKALAYPGVIAFYTAKDIPGINSFILPLNFVFISSEEIFASGSVQYFNQPIGVIVAETRAIAERAAKLVEATYKNVRDPVIDIKEAKDDTEKTTLFAELNATDEEKNVEKIISGANTIYGQYHFSIETLTTVIKPSEHGLDVHSSTHWTEGIQIMIAKALNMDQNRIDVHTRRVGGSFGIKVSRIIQGSIAAALAVQKLNRPCRFIQSLTTNMRALGKRLPCHSDFEAGVDCTGKIQYLNLDTYEDHGFTVNEQFNLLGLGVYYNAYDKSRWNFKSFSSTTDTASNTWARAPGTFENIAMAEFLMEQISYEMKLDPLDVRVVNLDAEYTSDFKEIIDNLVIKSDYKNRREMVTKFNSENRWKKRGLRLSFLRWTPIGGLNLYVNMSVYRGDGTVIITHGAIEMGQGINTKAVQVAAYLLNISVDKIKIKENNTVIAPNCNLSGGSVVNQNVIVGVRRACELLLERLQPVRDQMDNPTWEELITEAYNNNVDLKTHGFTKQTEEYTHTAYGVTIAEVEIDVLTGELEILRVDLCEDVGLSVSPEIDLGQVEGAFIMGMGYWTCENLVYSKTGELLTDRTWNYYVPLARDIPQDWRVYFRKNSYSEDIIFGSKCVGEPPICMAVVIALAIREAIVAARTESGIPANVWFPEDGPYTVERSCLLTSTNITDFKFN